MAIVRSQAVAGQASALAAASAERARQLLSAAEQRLRAEGYAAGRADAERAAAARLAEAEARIAALAAALAEAEARIAAAERRAQEAEARAEAALHERFGRTVDALQTALARLGALEAQLVAAAEAQIVELALAIAQRVLEHELAVDPAWMRDLLAAALAEIADRREIVVRCHPDDAAQIEARLPSAIQAAPGIEQLRVAPDPKLARGSLLLVAGGTRLDASVPASWERAAARLRALAPQPPLAMREDGSAPPPAEDAR
ncbi:MAG: FliH/SctL family protein [Planctomycetota bacterium]|nr:flagellar assembly protein FliH [Planctomycetota bacterium]MCX8040095.1 flagellar assembly protein FliH [Planctomycetota bacterium]MDW8372870.1 FliH/SctL family protein [Planctomycetota bacterium]